MGINPIFLGDIVDDLGGRFTVESFVGETDEVAVFNMVDAHIKIVSNFIKVGVITRVFGMEKIVNGRDRHRIAVAHDVIGNDIAGAEIVGVGGLCGILVAGGKKDERGSHKESEDGEEDVAMIFKGVEHLRESPFR